MMYEGRCRLRSDLSLKSSYYGLAGLEIGLGEQVYLASFGKTGSLLALNTKQKKKCYQNLMHYSITPFPYCLEHYRYIERTGNF